MSQVPEHDCGGLVTGCAACRFEGLFRSFTSAVRAITHGDANGPGGLEALAMSISGEAPFGNRNMAGAIEELTVETGRIADAIECLVDYAGLFYRNGNEPS